MDFKSIILTTLSDNVPELDGKIQAGAVDEKTAAPFATFTTPEEKPLRTLFAVARIAGWSAHRMEELTAGGKLIRPRYECVEEHRSYTPMEQR